MLLSTGAHMVPPYLTIPLMDNVLIPFQNGKPIDPCCWCCYMAACSARPCWPGAGLGQDLCAGAGVRAHRRRPAHHHLRAPAEAVAGIFRRQAHRRPDGAHRLESDRICVFLSLHLLDFPPTC
jgi:ATP-binding cassette subfamily B protein